MWDPKIEGLFKISDRRICNRMITMFKILNGIIHVPTESIVAFNTS